MLQAAIVEGLEEEVHRPQAQGGLGVLEAVVGGEDDDPGGGSGMLKVLVVEDEELIRKGIVLAVDWAALDCVVVGEAANGEEALEAVVGAPGSPPAPPAGSGQR